MVFHVLQGSGTLSSHVRQLSGKKLCDSSLSQRRQLLGFSFFHSLLEQVLTPLAEIKSNPEAFYKTLRLVAADGTQWSIANTPQIKKTTIKQTSRRNKSAFSKIALSALYELGTHHPLAARIGIHSESEMALSSELLPHLKSDQLLLADRYYGSPKMIATLLSLDQKPFFLIRVKNNLKSKTLYALKDGSFIVEIFDQTSQKKICLREIHALVKPRVGKWIRVRFWTNLLDSLLYPASELISLYAKRWEHESAYKELKVDLRRSDLLLSHTLVTASQEIACLLIAQSIVARSRNACAESFPKTLLEISFIKTLHLIQSLLSLWDLIHDLIPLHKLPLFQSRLLKRLQSQSSKKRRKRSCPRAIRKPVSSWPRLLKNTYKIGNILYKITKKRR
jgi:hypothetical protein